jgi:hypothetical protein
VTASAAVGFIVGAVIALVLHFLPKPGRKAAAH